MDLTQLAQMVTWLDEEHRRDRAEIARLQQRIEAQSSDIVEQARRKVKRNRVHLYCLDGNGVLEDEGYISGEHIPVVPMFLSRLPKKTVSYVFAGFIM